MGAQASCERQACCERNNSSSGEVLSGVQVEPPSFSLARARQELVRELDAQMRNAQLHQLEEGSASDPPSGGKQLCATTTTSTDVEQGPSTSLTSIDGPAVLPTPIGQSEVDPHEVAISIGLETTKREQSISSSQFTDDGTSVNLRRSSSLAQLAKATESENVVRAIPAWRVLWRFGRMIRLPMPEAFGRSHVVQRIDHFWSHSWSAPCNCKVFILLIYHNGFPSALVGTIVACLSTVELSVRASLVEMAFLVGLLTGVVSFALSIVWWPSRDNVFLDKACICQDDNDAKRDGIMSLGYLLTRSRTMLVLWDPTYFSRLWCVFEFTARLVIQERMPTAGKLKVIPCFMGFCVCITFWQTVAVILLQIYLTMTVNVPHPTFAILSQADFWDHAKGDLIRAAAMFCSLSAFSPKLLKYLRAFGLQTKQLEEFSLSKAKCFCCSVGHKHPATGADIPCDRKLIEGAVLEWFTSVASYDKYVQKSIKDHVPSRAIVPYRYALLLGMPFLWEGLGGFMWLVRRGNDLDGGFLLIERLFAVFFDIPVEWVIILAVFSFFKGGALDPEIPSLSRAVGISAVATLALLPKFVLDSYLHYQLGAWLGFIPRCLLYFVTLAVVYWPVGQRLRALLKL